MSKLTDAVLALAEPVAAQQGCEIWDVEYVKEAGSRYLRVYIDKPDGVSIQDCEDFSRALDPILAEAAPIPDSFIVQVPMLFEDYNYLAIDKGTHGSYLPVQMEPERYFISIPSGRSKRV